MIDPVLRSAVLRADALARAGAELLRTSGLQQALAAFGEVRATGSFFAGLAVRPEIDLLVLTRGAVTPELRERLGRRLYAVTDARSVEHAVLPIKQSTGEKYFVRAETGPRRHGDAEFDWTIDVAVWHASAWSARYGTPRPQPGRAPLDAAQRALVVALKAELLDTGRRDTWTTTNLCDAVLDGRITSLADLRRSSADTRRDPR